MNLQPILYFPHGAGPMPLLGEPHHASLVKFFSTVAQRIEKPKCILMISAHWEEPIPTINCAESPSLLFDYDGFPPESYEFRYAAKGSSDVSHAVNACLNNQGIESAMNDQRGWDHGVFVPLKLMYPTAEIPCVQLSLVNSMNPQTHLNIGRALASLREQGVLILGSGSSFHNMSLVHGVSMEDREKSIQFDDWLTDVLTSENFTTTERTKQLTEWKKAPYAEFSHPREEHLLPLLVCYGASIEHDSNASTIFNELFMGVKVSAFRWD